MKIPVLKTDNIIRAAIDNRLPNQIMMLFHPQWWSEGGLIWLKEMDTVYNENTFT